MSVHKKGGRWYYAVYQGIKNGKRVYEWSSSFDSKTDAQLAELEQRKKVLENGHKIYKKESFPYVAEKWLEMRKINIADSTYRQNLGFYESSIKKYFESYLIKNIDNSNVLDFMLQLDLAPATTNKIMNILKQIFDFAIFLKQINSNPCSGINKPAIRKKKKAIWSEREIDKFLKFKNVKESPCYVAFLLLFSTGMRPGEVCGLRWRDWEEDTLTPEFGISKHGEETDLKNEKAHEPVYIDQFIITNLKRTELLHKELYMAKGKELTADEYINVLLPDFRPIKPDYLNKTFQKLVMVNGMKKIALYGARHSLGTNMMRDGVNPKIVADIMRHTSVRTTLDNYSHVDKNMYKNAMKSYNNKFLDSK